MKRLTPLVVALWAVQGCDKTAANTGTSPTTPAQSKTVRTDKVRRMIRDIKPELSNEKIGHLSSAKAFDLLVDSASLKPALLEASLFTREFGYEELELVLKSEFDVDERKETLQHEVFRMMIFAAGGRQDATRFANEEDAEMDKAKQLLNTPEPKARAEKLSGMLLKAVPELEAVKNPTGDKEWQELVARILAPTSTKETPDPLADSLREAAAFERDYGFHPRKLVFDRTLGSGSRKDEFGRDLPSIRQLFGNLLSNLQKAEYQKDKERK